MRKLALLVAVALVVTFAALVMAKQIWWRPEIAGKVRTA